MHQDDVHTNAILRPAEAQDEPFLFQVYASTRADEMALVDWSEEQKHAFLSMQFNAQRSDYGINFPGAVTSVITLEPGGVPIGRMIVDRSCGEIHLMDIALLPECRGAGIGSRLVQDLQDEARAKKQSIVLYVEVFNPAIHLYERLGFARSGASGIYFKMEWPA